MKLIPVVCREMGNDTSVTSVPPHFGVLVPGKLFLGTRRSEESGEKNVFYLTILDAQNVKEIVVFLMKELPTTVVDAEGKEYPTAEVGAEVSFCYRGGDVKKEWMSLGYLSKDKTFEKFKIDCFKPVSSSQNSNILLRISRKPLKDLKQKFQKQDTQKFIDEFNSSIAPKYIFKSKSDLPIFTPMEILKVQDSDSKPGSKGKIFALLGKDKIYFNLAIEDHERMLETNTYYKISQHINQSNKLFCFVFPRKNVKIGFLQYDQNIAEKAEKKEKLAKKEIPPSILEQADMKDVEELCE